MNRRSFLSAFAATTGAILLPQPEPVRVYSFITRAMTEQAEFEWALRRSAETGVPAGGHFSVHRYTEMPPHAAVVGARLTAYRNAHIYMGHPTNVFTHNIIGWAPGECPS